MCTVKLTVVGCEQCGGRIADEFVLLGKATHGKRGIDVVTNVLAANTDITDLSSLSHSEASLASETIYKCIVPYFQSRLLF